jgi:RNA polymerase sigma-70 factor (ECF subfamily)
MKNATMTPPPDTGRARLVAFVERHQRGLRRWLLSLGADPMSAEDHCQETLLAAMHHGVADWTGRRAWAWLRTTAQNFLRMQLRRERRAPLQSLDDVEQAWHRAGGDDDGGDAALDALRRCLEQADGRDRELLDRRYADGQGRGEMARALGLGEAGVKQALRRARARLRTCMEHRMEEQR